jgi:hypothetical protein
MQAGDHIPSIALIFSGLVSIPQCEIRKTSSFPAKTLNTHLSEFNIVHVERNLSKTMTRLSNRDECDLILMMMSSTYTSTKSLIWSLNVLCMSRIKVGRAFLRPYIRHGDIAKEVIYYYKCNMLFIFSRHRYLMKTRISI